MGDLRRVCRKLTLAPMMGVTDQHFRYLMHLIAPDALIYTAMITAAAVFYSGKKSLFIESDRQFPVAMQLGGADPEQLAYAAKLAQQHGYCEVNLNVGCPSDRVKSGRFGACMMKNPQLVAECVAAMKQVVDIPVTVKTRIGVDDQDSYSYLYDFIKQLQHVGVDAVIMHARKAWLNGLNPKQNRVIPPLKYQVVYQLKKDFPRMPIIVNGGIKTIEDVQSHLNHVDGVMIGRYAQQDMMAMAGINHAVHTESVKLDIYTILAQYAEYMSQQNQQGVPWRTMTRHLIGMFHGCSGARRWRRLISETGNQIDEIKKFLACALHELDHDHSNSCCDIND